VVHSPERDRASMKRVGGFRGLSMVEERSNGEVDHQKLIAENEFARDNRIQGDASAWETTAIIWGGQTLLLGFALEAISKRPAQPLVVLLGILGVIMCVFNAKIMKVRRDVCQYMIQVCTQIEEKLQMDFKPQSGLSKDYPKGFQTGWFGKLNWSFGIVWVLFMVRAAWLYLCLYP
jgi:hypothetical protein